MFNNAIAEKDTTQNLDASRTTDHFFALPLPFDSPREGDTIIDNIYTNDNGEIYFMDYPTITVQQASSCLVKVQSGDYVFALFHNQKFFITDILVRLDQNETTVVGTPEMRLHIQAHDISLEIKQQFSLHASSVNIFSSATQWICDSWRQIAQSLHIEALHAHRNIKNTDIVKAKHIVQHAEQSLSMRGKVTTVQADALLKMDGSQVHMG
jgi:hypothetical protein